MAVDGAAIMGAMVSYAQDLGIFTEVLGAEPKSAPAINDATTLALWTGPIRPMTSGLNTASFRWEIQGRVYRSAFSKPIEYTEYALAGDVFAYFTSLMGRFTLGGLVRCVDERGMEGDGLNAEPGYVEADGKVFRIMDLRIPLLINDVMSEAP